MKALGIQIKSAEAILVVLERSNNGSIIQSSESTKFKIDDPTSCNQVRQFRDQVNASLDTINADIIGLLARNAKAKGTMAVSPMSFKLEGIFQLYEKKDILIVWPQTISSFLKKEVIAIQANKVYQEDAFNVAYHLLNK